MTDLNRLNRKISAEAERFEELRAELLDIIGSANSARSLRQYLESALNHISEAEVRMFVLRAQKEILEELAEETA
jgi:hypothetical protein